MFTLTPTLDLIDQLRFVEIRADLDPALVAYPGVWVQVAGFAPFSQGTFKTDLRLQLVTDDADARRAMDALLDLAREVRAVVPFRDARARTVYLPDGTPLPGLEIRTTVTGPLALPAPEGVPAP